MRVIHVNYNDAEGGAAKAAIRLVEAQRRHGVDSQLLVLKKTTNKDYVHTVAPLARILSQICHLFSQKVLLRLFGRGETEVYRSLNLFFSFLGFKIRSLKPDIVHIHWIGNETMAFYQLSRLGVPVIWTMHDMWTFCASEHYPPESEYFRFMDGYQGAVNTKSRLALNADRLLYKAKMACFAEAKIEFVAPSDWMRVTAERSHMLAGKTIHHINNCSVDDIYKPMSKQECRELLGLPQHSKVLAFGAVNAISDPRKGYPLLREALNILSKLSGVEVAIFGASPGGMNLEGISVHWLGTIADDAKMASIYNAVDIFVAPSLQDNLPNTVVEALSCGTPCVAFDVGGMSELINDIKLGIVVKDIDGRSLSEAISAALSYEFSKEYIAESARKKRGESIIVEQYVGLYRRANESRLTADVSGR